MANSFLKLFHIFLINTLTFLSAGQKFRQQKHKCMQIIQRRAIKNSNFLSLFAYGTSFDTNMTQDFSWKFEYSLMCRYVCMASCDSYGQYFLHHDCRLIIQIFGNT